ncbi:hypothetical protein V2E24_02805 [Mycoplasmopsis ciconiae]|uniref:Inhibitor of apoptosis-promoting Bax1 n=1 Tax=Mycoplasmopsis ciconiae TaxID=561067 RepID=A0ABU7MLT0_9BACT|nr:hypothetical protein [Mycoplasmopsis ciconiae]
MNNRYDNQSNSNNKFIPINNSQERIFKYSSSTSLAGLSSIIGGTLMLLSVATTLILIRFFLLDFIRSIGNNFTLRLVILIAGLLLMILISVFQNKFKKASMAITIPITIFTFLVFTFMLFYAAAFFVISDSYQQALNGDFDLTKKTLKLAAILLAPALGIIIFGIFGYFELINVSFFNLILIVLTPVVFILVIVNIFVNSTTIYSIVTMVFAIYILISSAIQSYMLKNNYRYLTYASDKNEFISTSLFYGINSFINYIVLVVRLLQMFSQNN